MKRSPKRTVYSINAEQGDAAFVMITGDLNTCHPQA